MRRKRMKSNLVSSGTIRMSGMEGCSRMSARPSGDCQLSWTCPPDPPGHDQARQREGRERGGDNADTQRHREAAYRSGTDKEQNSSRDKGGDIGIEDGCERACEAGINRVDGGTSAAHLLADAFIDQDIAVHCNPDRENNADDAG